MLSLLKSPMVAQLERQGARVAMTALRSQKRTLMVPHVAQRNKHHGVKRIFVPRGQRKGIKEERKPTVALANDLPLSFQEMDNSTLVTLGNLGEHDACVEMLKRHIMDVDSCDYDTASVKFKEIGRSKPNFTVLHYSYLNPI